MEMRKEAPLEAIKSSDNTSSLKEANRRSSKIDWEENDIESLKRRLRAMDMIAIPDCIQFLQDQNIALRQVIKQTEEKLRAILKRAIQVKSEQGEKYGEDQEWCGQ